MYQTGVLLMVAFKLAVLTSCFPTGLIFDVVQRDKSGQYLTAYAYKDKFFNAE